MRRESNPPATNTRNTGKCETVPFLKTEFDRHLRMESQANVEPLSPAKWRKQSTNWNSTYPD